MEGDAPTTDQGAEPFFSPDRTAPHRGSPGRPIGVRRLLIRVVVCVLAIVALDRAIAPTFAPPAAYLRSYRLPRAAPTTALADYANAIDLAARLPDHAPIAVFLGASPTFGHRIKSAANTFPYAYASAAASAGTPVQAFNVAANGQFVGDYYILAKRLIDDADVLFVQLTYHTFSPAARAGLDVRYPELPEVLGVPLTREEATALGLRPSAGTTGTPPASSMVGSTLSRWWTLWRERDLIDRRIFGGSPRDALARLLAPVTDPAATSASAPATVTTLPEDAANDGFATFDALDPGRQMMVVARYAEDSSFTIGPADSEVLLLDRLAARIAAAHKKAVFFMGPLNESVIGSYGLIDPKQYARNVALLTRKVAAYGFPLIDQNTGAHPLPGSDFADISHTNDEGGSLVGAWLFRDSRQYLRTVTP